MVATPFMGAQAKACDYRRQHSCCFWVPLAARWLWYLFPRLGICVVMSTIENPETKLLIVKVINKLICRCHCERSDYNLLNPPLTKGLRGICLLIVADYDLFMEFGFNLS
ncbi:MAG: hypothetical protein KGJ87_08780 [Planctomycetota bacterium]|nr:hypothetical protein [Planctomycetota bacterium]